MTAPSTAMSSEEAMPDGHDMSEGAEEGLQRILLGRNLDRVLAYVRMKMDLAVATNAELSAIRTQVLQMGSFLTVALVLGTGGLDSFFDWDRNVLFASLTVTLLVVLMAASGMRVSSQYTDIVLDEHHAFEALYALIVWEGCDDIDAIAREVCAIEQETRAKVDSMNRRHRLLAGTILHTMMHFERHSPFQDDIGTMHHRLPHTGESGHLGEP
jgi:hypothetical protein